MMQPEATSGAVAKPNSSAPNKAPTTTSRPVLIWPSTCTRTRLRKWLRTKVCCVSAKPYSPRRTSVLNGGEGRGASAAIVPGNHNVICFCFGNAGGNGSHADFATSLTEISACGLAFFRSCRTAAPSPFNGVTRCGGGEIKPMPGTE